MRVLDYGSSALLLEVDSTASAAALHRALQDSPPSGVVEIMPGLRTVLVRFDPAVVRRSDLAARVVAYGASAEAPAGGAVEPPSDREPVTVRVEYTGADLGFVAEHCGLNVDQVIAAHLEPIYRVVLIGMAPGFYFLAGGPVSLTVPRRPTPRTEVGKGAVGLAGDLTGIYPRTGPGGWQLIGRAVDDLWHPTRLPAALHGPGTAIRFVAA